MFNFLPGSENFRIYLQRIQIQLKIFAEFLQFGVKKDIQFDLNFLRFDRMKIVVGFANFANFWSDFADDFVNFANFWSDHFSTLQGLILHFQH